MQDITRVPSGEEWSRFQFFARRVREIVIQDSDDDDEPYATHPHVFDILREHYPGPILPNLERLDFLACYNPENVTLFVQPSLRWVNFMPDDIDVARDLLSLLQTKAPNLENISMSSGVEFLADICDRFSKTICTMNHLQCLNFARTPLSNDALIHLSSLPSLRIFRLEVRQENATAWTSPRWGRFANLLTLRVATALADTSVLASFLDALDKTGIVSLAVVCSAQARPTALDSLFAAIGRFNPQRLMKCTVDFDAAAAGADGWDGDAPTFATLAPLLRLRLLMHVELRALPVELTTGDVHELAGAWPCLRRLLLEPGTEARRGASVALADLADLAARCRMLEHLAVEARPPPDGWAWAPRGPCPPSLAAHLDLRDTRVPRAVAQDVVAFLADVFPFAHATFERPLWDLWDEEEVPLDEGRAVMAEICKEKNDLVSEEHVQVAAMLRTLASGGMDMPALDYI